MLRVAYLFERFPSFGQTFCHREVAELLRQGAEVHIFSIRTPRDEPPQAWDPAVLKRVTYLPEEKELVAEIDRAVRAGELPAAATRALQEWGRQSDFLRLYQAAYIGLRLRAANLARVHAHFAGMAARTAYWLREFFGIDFSLTAHANDIFAPRAFVIDLEKIFAAARAIVTVSDFSAEQLRARFPAQAAKVWRVYNGIEVARFPRANFAAQPPRVVSVGRLIAKKGFADLIAACACLKERGVSLHCAIVGEGPLRETLARQIARAQLADMVELCGPRPESEIMARLGAAQLFVLPCTREADGGMDNLPTVIMEAMAAGLPVISTPLAGVPEMVQPGVTGELVPEGEVAALAEAMETLLRDRAQAERYGAAARARAAERFGLATNVRMLAEILAQE